MYNSIMSKKVHTLIGNTKQVITIVYQRSLITGHHNKYSNDEKVWNFARIAKMWHRDGKWANIVGKMAPVVLFDAGFPPILNL